MWKHYLSEPFCTVEQLICALDSYRRGSAERSAARVLVGLDFNSDVHVSGKALRLESDGHWLTITAVREPPIANARETLHGAKPRSVWEAGADADVSGPRQPR